MSTTPTRLPAGKLPQDLLRRLLARVEHTDRRVLVGPGIGRDAAAVAFGGRALVAASDPVTFAAEQVGWYAVHVNANDVACLGARPRWFLATVLLPDPSDASLAAAVLDQIRDACRDLGVELIGGHTEVAPGLDRPVVAGTMLGETARERLVTAAGAAVGDAVLLTKGLALEGTAILAREARDALLARGVPPAVVDAAARLLFSPGISVVPEAATAAAGGAVHAMHDPTEGGLATALHELAEAAGVGVALDREAVPVLPETEAVCAALGLDPLGLLASGALLLTVPQEEAGRLTERLAAAGVRTTQIGRIIPAAEGTIMRTPAGPVPLPRFPRDELARWFDEAAVSG